MSVDLSQFLGVFYEESEEGLALVESTLLEIDLSSPDAEAINAIFRAMHSLKGGSGTFGLKEITDLTHGEETLLDEIRSGHRPLTTELVNHLLQAVDVLRTLLASKREGQPLDMQDADRLRQECENILHERSTQAVGTDQAVEPVHGDSLIWEIKFHPQLQVLQTGNDVLRIFRDLRERVLTWEVHVDTGRLPEWTSLDSELNYLAWTLRVSGVGLNASILAEPFEWIVDDCELSIVSLPREQEVIRHQAAEHEPVHAIEAEVVNRIERPRDKESASIRVGLDKIDALVNLVGELVITQSMLNQIGEHFDMRRIDRLLDGLAQMAQHTRMLQENVMRIRMLPISFAFSRFPRLVRDTASQLGKSIRLVMHGENTELDKTVLEKIGDPLTHLVRNAMDHGLEPPEERTHAGKSATGTLTLDAYHQSGHIIIEVRDDGRGLNVDRIRAKAVEKGLIAADAVLSEREIHDLIFAPGFSTADKVSDLSGRGVGMDVVRSNVLALKGSVHVSTRAGQGSTFTIRLPLTLAILEGQLVQLADQVFVLPMVSMLESISLDETAIGHVAGGTSVYALRGDYIPVVRLEDIFRINRKGSKEVPKDSILVIVESGQERVALLVDALLEQQQVVIKSLETHYQHVPGISGATILGDGRVSLIIDVSAVVGMAGNLAAHQQRVKSLAHAGEELPTHG
ncbi:MAG: chemotaxis protein CheA [Pseudomonadales bacterium]|nr:chemotaxis protein CheA [Pseudomonadales bacterium]